MIKTSGFYCSKILSIVLFLGFVARSALAASLPIVDRNISPPKISALEATRILDRYVKEGWHDGGRYFIVSITYGSPTQLGYIPEHNWAGVTKLDEPSWFITVADTKSTQTWIFRLFDSGKIESIGQLAT